MKQNHMVMTIFVLIGAIAVMGLVLTFAGENTGLYFGTKVYGGAIKQVAFPYTEGRMISGGSQGPVAESQQAYKDTGMSIYKRRSTDRIYSVLTSCRGMAANQVIPPEYTYEFSFREIIDRGIDWKNDCINAMELNGPTAYCCKTSGTHSRFY